MKTVPTVVASSSALAASALGLAFVRQDFWTTSLPVESERTPSRRSRSAPLSDMSATAVYTVSPVDSYASPDSFTFSSPPFMSLGPRSTRSAGTSREHTPNHVDTDMDASKRSLKRRKGARDSTGMSFDTMLRSAAQESEEQSSGGLQVTQHPSWLKRLSTFSSNEGSLPSSPRPPSTAVSQSNGSVAFSNSGSTAPMFPSFAPVQPPPNKLVKRSSSIRSTKASSRIPLPTFKRPATSHERDATLQRRPSTASSGLPFPPSVPQSTDSTWKTYFTPKVTMQEPTTTSRRNSTSIPNPIKRVIPDRRHHPVLVSGNEKIERSEIEFDQASVDEDITPRFMSSRNSVSLRATRRFFSSPLPQRPPTASTNNSASLPRSSRDELTRSNAPSFGSSNRNSRHLPLDQPDTVQSSPLISNTRSFSPVTSAPKELPKWKRPSKTKPADVKYRRKGLRNSLGPESTMGNTDSITAIETERPFKRRDVSGSSQRSSLQSREGSIRSPSLAFQESQPKKSASPGQTKTLQAFATDSPNPNSRTPSFYSEHASVHYEPQTISSPATASLESRHARQSGTVSEFASSFAGSDSDARYHDDDGFDSPDEMHFDSVRTRATSAGSTAFKAPRIDAIFDETRINPIDHRVPLAQDGYYQSAKLATLAFERPRHSIIEEEESVSTPVRSHYNGSTKQTPETFRFGSSPVAIASSPPMVPTIFRRKPSTEIGLGMGDTGDDDVWDFGDDETASEWPLAARRSVVGATFDNSTEPNQDLSTLSGYAFATPSKPFLDPNHDARSNIFEWSEQQPMEKSPAGRSPPRPRTVHGKKDAENRGSRSVGRRAPSALHVRSQSVPVAQETDGKRSQVVTNKFGTWGVGSKGVTEDWNEDFDFEEPVPAVPVAHQQDQHQTRYASTGGMNVPKAIQEQQNNVLANIGLLRDWGLLIEELKELRIRAASLQIIGDLKDPMWYEVDAMIDLADQESNDHTLAPRQSPPSSPSFDYGAFDEPLPSVPMRNSPRTLPKLHAEDIFDSPSPSPARTAFKQNDKPITGRPRKDSEAVARSVIEALQQKRNVSDPTGNSTGGASRKVPFDTATLRRIVPYVQELRDQIKRSIREAEGLYSSPRADRAEHDPTFSRMFQDPPESPTYSRGQRRSLARSPEHIMADDSSSRSPPPDEISRRMELMTIG